MSADKSTDDMYIITALYDADVVLSAVKANDLNGYFDLEPNKSYTMKIFAWDRTTLEPKCSSFTFGDLKTTADAAIPQTGYTQSVPPEYTRAASEQGTVVPLEYDTRDYVRDGATIQKTAYVYLPYGYDENDTETRYDILYLMHGWGGHAGEYFEFTSQKNMFDNLIEKGDMPPTIMVSASFYNDIYTDAEKAADSAKKDTGLFFFKGNENAKFAIVNAGGGFSYVGAMHDSFPHALELSKKGYNAFALIYRPGWDTAMEDLARAIAFIHEHADELGVDTDDYSLWGGSAGARMAATLGSHATDEYGEKEYPRPAAVIMQYTGHSEVTGNEPPTYNCVGTSDGIASYTTMQNRIECIKASGTDTMIEIFDGLPHGFGLGEGTIAYGWLDRAVEFWERNMNK